MFVGTIKLGLSNDATWKESPTGFLLTASKRMPRTLKKPLRPETKYIAFPPVTTEAYRPNACHP